MSTPPPLSPTVYCGKCGLSFHEHEYDNYNKEGRKKRRIIYFCKCPNCKETIHKDNEMVECCGGEKFCWVCINDDHIKHKHPEKRYL